MWSLPTLFRLLTHGDPVSNGNNTRWLAAEEQRQIEEVRERLERVQQQLQTIERRQKERV